MSDITAAPTAPSLSGEGQLATKSSDESWLPGPKPPSESWSRKKFYTVLFFVLVLHVALIALFGTKRPVRPRAVTNVPHLQLANSANEMITLNDPTLFARPNSHDIVSAFWRRITPPQQPNFDYTEPLRYLPPNSTTFGATLHQFVQNSRPSTFALNFKPEPKSTLPSPPFDLGMPQKTTMEISGDLARRRLLNPIAPPTFVRNDVIAPTVVQALVDSAGNVFSAVVLKNNTSTETDNAADQQALHLVRNLRFVPGPNSTFGQITFTWHTVPTNAVPVSVP